VTPVPDDVERRLNEHLQRASERLRADKLDEAEREITAAVALRPDDLRVRNLRGLHLFRAGRYEEARTIYLELATVHPDDAALRLNLGLVELRMAKHAEAAVNLRRVIASEPDNARAQGYLGLALMRLGELPAARDALVKGGQTELAKQVEERIAHAEGTPAAAGAPVEAPLAAVELEEPIDEAKRGAGSARRPGELVLRPSMPVAAFATARLLAPGEPFALAEGGMLVLRVDGRLPTRTFGAIASTGSLTFEPLLRRIRAQPSDEPFGDGAEAMFVAVGKGVMAVAARGARFELLSLADDILYVRESAVFSFEESLGWENGRVPGGGAEGLRVTQFRGHGRVVLRTVRPLYTLKIDPDAPLFVEGTTLLGWIGRVVPRVLRGEGDQPTPYVECTGEGVLILEEPPAI
jgi:tetratricopeptide (TPR) repeat protein